MLRHKGLTKASFDAICIFNKMKVQSLSAKIQEEQSSNDAYLEKLEKWTPKPSAENISLLKKVFIIGPSRSGKTSLELLLSASSRVEPLGEAIDIGYKKSFDFDDLFYKSEKKIKSDGRDMIVSTRPSTINYVMELYEQLPDCYFIFVDRMHDTVKSEIFFTNYRDRNYYSYNKNSLNNYMNFYKKAVDILHSKIKSRVLNLNFSEIVSHPHQELRKIETFLTVDLAVQRKNLLVNRSKLTSEYDIYIEHLECLT